MTDLETPKNFLGIEIEKEEERNILNQGIKQFGLTGCKECTFVRTLPAPKTKELNKIETTIYLSAKIPYR